MFKGNSFKIDRPSFRELIDNGRDFVYSGYESTDPQKCFLFGDKTEYDYVKKLETLINEFYSKNLLFFEVTFSYERQLSYYCRTSGKLSNEDVSDWKSTLFSNIEDVLESIKFLEFVYGRHIREEKEVVFLIAVRSLMGYNKNSIYYNIPYEDSSYFYADIKYLNRKAKIFKTLNKIIKGHDLNNLYFYIKIYYSPIINFFIDTNYKPNLLMNLYFINIYKNVYGSRAKLFEENDSFYNQINYFNHIEFHSIRKKSYISIINMWNMYMILNNLYYNLEDNKIYKKVIVNLDGKKIFKYEYFSEFDYLSKNSYSIFSFLKKHFRDLLDGFPILDLLRENLHLANERISYYLKNFLPILNIEKDKEELSNDIFFDRSSKFSDEASFYLFEKENYFKKLSIAQKVDPERYPNDFELLRIKELGLSHEEYLESLKRVNTFKHKYY